MAESYKSEEQKRKAPGEIKNKIKLDPAFRKFCMEYKARSEDSWREFDQTLNNVPVSAESYLVMQALASGADISLQEVARELISDGIAGLLARAKAEGLVQEAPDDTSGF